MKPEDRNTPLYQMLKSKLTDILQKAVYGEGGNETEYTNPLDLISYEDMNESDRDYYKFIIESNTPDRPSFDEDDVIKYTDDLYTSVVEHLKK